MTSRHSPGHRDKNESLITDILKTYHIPYLLLSEGAGADILVELAPMFLVEVKNPSQRPSGQKLTDTEQAQKEICEAQGIGYFVVLYSDQMAEILRARL